MKAKPDQHNCHSLVDNEAVNSFKDDGVEGGDNKGHIWRKWNHCVDQQ